MWSKENWQKQDGTVRVVDYVVGVGAGLIIAAAIAGNHTGATELLIIIGCVLVVVPLLGYLFWRLRK